MRLSIILLNFLAANAFAAAVPATTGPTRVSDAEVAELRELAQLSRLSYCNAQLAVNGFNCNICDGPVQRLTKYDQINSSDNGATQAYVAVDESKKTIYLSVRGASETSNWIDGITFPRTRLRLPNVPSDVSMHRGFQDAYESNDVKKLITTKIGNLVKEHPSFAVSVIGHSYGGGIATLAAADIVASNITTGDKVSLLTIGTPRLGNYEFARYLEKLLGNVRRITHSYDLITRLPGRAFGFRHPSKEMFIDIDGKQMLQCTDMNEDEDESLSCNNKYPVTKLGMTPHTSFFDHTDETSCKPVNASAPIKVGFLRFELITFRP